MHINNRGAVLIGLVLFFTVLALSSGVGILERDTKLKRFSEDDLKLNLGALRRAIELYRYKYGVTDPDAGKIAALDTALLTGPATLVTSIIAGESFVRARVATGSMKWNIIANAIKNPSFEKDDGEPPYIDVGGWLGNFTANDGVPDGWKLTSGGAEQVVTLAPAVYVVSFWAKCNTPTSGAKVKMLNGVSLLCELTADSGTQDHTTWKRYFKDFEITATPADIKLELVQYGTLSGDSVYLDGIMLEKWNPPAGVPVSYKPVPSAWTSNYNLVSAQASVSLQLRQFQEMLPSGALPASYAWWFQW